MTNGEILMDTPLQIGKCIVQGCQRHSMMHMRNHIKSLRRENIRLTSRLQRGQRIPDNRSGLYWE